MKSIIKYVFFKSLESLCKGLNWLLNEGLIFTWVMVLLVMHYMHKD